MFQRDNLLPPAKQEVWLGVKLEMTNCLGYAVNAPSSDGRVVLPWPGYRAEEEQNPPDKDMPTAELTTRLARDGIRVQRTRPLGWRVRRGHLVAIFRKHPDSSDWHLYRRDSNGLWSHKQGALAPTSLDSKGAMICDPTRCARGEYVYFIGWGLCRSDRVRRRAAVRPEPDPLLRKLLGGGL